MKGSKFWIAVQEKRKKAEHENFVELKRHRLEIGEAKSDGLCQVELSERRKLAEKYI